MYISFPAADDTKILVPASNIVQIETGTDSLSSAPPVTDVSSWDFSAISTLNPSASSGVLTATSGGAQFTFTTDAAGIPAIDSVTLNNAGSGYEVGDTITVVIASANAINGDGADRNVTLLLTAEMLTWVARIDYGPLNSDGADFKLLRNTISCSTNQNSAAALKRAITRAIEVSMVEEVTTAVRLPEGGIASSSIGMGPTLT